MTIHVEFEMFELRLDACVSQLFNLIIKDF